MLEFVARTGAERPDNEPRSGRPHSKRAGHSHEYEQHQPGQDEPDGGHDPSEDDADSQGWNEADGAGSPTIGPKGFGLIGRILVALDGPGRWAGDLRGRSWRPARIGVLGGRSILTGPAAAR
jgi:hypothetical protein